MRPLTTTSRGIAATKGRETRWFAIQKTLKAAIENAGMARSPSGKRLNHQRRIPVDVLRAWTEELHASSSQPARSGTVVELHEIVSAKAQEM